MKGRHIPQTLKVNRNPLTNSGFNTALNFLAEKDTDLGEVLSVFGPPPLWVREPGFGSLLYIILEQQVSIASARATFSRLKAIVPFLTPGSFLALDPDALKAVGFSRQKIRYGRILAEAVQDGDLDLGGLNLLDDDAARKAMMKVTGIGRWTADVYLLTALRRPDVLPVGDLALMNAARQVKRLEERPTPALFESIGEGWRPWRSVAARILWHAYLKGVWPEQRY
ncbi:MAG: DNA-3-methyladenine glycosylase family protein [Desulfobacterales bacterium]